MDRRLVFCGDCLFWDSRSTEEEGLCLCNPPTSTALHINGKTISRSSFPSTGAEDRCGAGVLKTFVNSCVERLFRGIYEIVKPPAPLNCWSLDAKHELAKTFMTTTDMVQLITSRSSQLMKTGYGNSPDEMQKIFSMAVALRALQLSVGCLSKHADSTPKKGG